MTKPVTDGTAPRPGRCPGSDGPETITEAHAAEAVPYQLSGREV